MQCAPMTVARYPENPGVTRKIGDAGLGLSTFILSPIAPLLVNPVSQ